MDQNVNPLQIKHKEKLGFWQRQLKNIKKNKSLIFFIIPSIIITFIFGYIPMAGVIFAFKERIRPFNWLYDALTQPFTFEHIISIFKNRDVITALSNTLIISGTKILLQFPLTIIFAILLSEIKRPNLSKLILIIVCLPNFLSWPVTVGIWNNLLGRGGLVDNIITGLGGETIYFFDDYFKPMVIWLSIWKGLGWGSIFFYSAIMSIDKEYYEAAKIEGASKIQTITKLTIPAIMPVIALQLVMNITYILDAGFDQVYAMIQLAKQSTYTEQILGTYIFNEALKNTNIPFTVAMSVVNGTFALVLMLVGNTIVKKRLGRSLW